MPVGEPFVIQPQKMQDRGMQIVNVHSVLNGIPAEFVGLAVNQAALSLRLPRATW